MARHVMRAVSWVVLLGATALVTLAVLVPRVAGATPYTVLTGSMSPASSSAAISRRRMARTAGYSSRM